jgi:hypothetical protein
MICQRRLARSLMENGIVLHHGRRVSSRRKVLPGFGILLLLKSRVAERQMGKHAGNLLLVMLRELFQQMPLGRRSFIQDSFADLLQG